MENNLPHFWNVLTAEEKLKYFKDLGDRLLEHRYRYYAQDNPIVEDWIYDNFEKTYVDVARYLNLEPSAIDMVGWDITKLGAQEAALRVEQGVDPYTIHQKGLEAIWEKLGPPRYTRQNNE